MGKRTDKYANLMNAHVITNGATAVHEEIQTGVSLGEGKGIIIDEINYQINQTVITDFIAGAAGDYLACTFSVQGDEFGLDNVRVIHEHQITKWDDGTAANSYLINQPAVYQFNPPIIVASPRVYFNCIASASIAGGAVYARVFFRYVDLSSQEYLELAESFVLMQ
ncbi:unnamed protein product [marine sediment metagenome]|uniref:Uncharacterized protein n=1 Tax=marine sediment metagenome TaxID=412755 RepID=X1SFA2_9ZZZZ